jgi:toxin YoeB
VGRTFTAQPQFLEDLIHWVETEPPIAQRILRLVEAALRDPQKGIGKPEPLKGAFRGCWSRRITQEHRLVYRVSESAVDFLQCRYHYE